MTSVVQQLQAQISDHRNRINAHNQRQKKLTKLLEKEQPFRDAIHVRSVGVVPGSPGCKKISHDLARNFAYKERRLKRFSDELSDINGKCQDATQKLIELEDDLIDAQNQIATEAAEAIADERAAQVEVPARETLAERKAEIAASLGVEPSAISDQELLPRE